MAAAVVGIFGRLSSSVDPTEPRGHQHWMVVAQAVEVEQRHVNSLQWDVGEVVGFASSGFVPETLRSAGEARGCRASGYPWFVSTTRDADLADTQGILDRLSGSGENILVR